MQNATDGDSGSMPKDQADKKEEILGACKASDIPRLTQLATSPGGLLQDDIRQVAWPLLLGYDTLKENHELGEAWKELPRHRDEDQVRLDVNRAFVYYPTNKTEKEMDAKKVELSDLITQVIRTHPLLCYFQGYHDIVQVLLLVLGKRHAPPAVARISLLRIRDYMLPSLSPALKHLQLLPAIIRSADEAVWHRIANEKPFFALSATLTLYAHDIEQYADIGRLYDFLLAHEPVVALYLFAAIILSRTDELLDIPADEPEMLHFTLSKLPKPLNLDLLISDAMNLYQLYPPEDLPFRAWSKIPTPSVLKTSRRITARSTLDEAERLFQKQTEELRREELRQKAMVTLWKYRRPVGSIALAVVVGVLSVWVRRGDNSAFMGVVLRRAWEAFRNRR